MTAYHHPGSEPRGHPDTECSPERCGRPALSATQSPAGAAPTPSPASAPSSPATPGTGPDTPRSRPLLLITAEEDGTVLNVLRMNAHGPGGLIQQVHEITTSREVSAEAAGLTRLNPARWQVTDLADQPGAFWRQVLSGQVSTSVHYHDADPAAPCLCTTPGTHAASPSPALEAAALIARLEEADEVLTPGHVAARYRELLGELNTLAPSDADVTAAMTGQDGARFRGSADLSPNTAITAAAAIRQGHQGAGHDEYDACEELAGRLERYAAERRAQLMPPEDQDRECSRCGDRTAYLSTDNLCDGCAAEHPAVTHAGEALEAARAVARDAVRQVEAVLDVLAPRVDLGDLGPAIGADSVRVPRILLDHDGTPVMPSDAQVRSLAEQIVTAIRTAS